MIHSLQLKPPQQLSERATLAHDDFWDAQHLYNIVEHLDVIGASYLRRPAKFSLAEIR